MAKKMGSLVRKILSEVGRNEMLSWGTELRNENKYIN
mgnify:CR=1 FL=1